MSCCDPLFIILIIITWQSRAGRQSWNSTVCSGQDWDVLAEIVEKQTEGR